MSDSGTVKVTHPASCFSRSPRDVALRLLLGFAGQVLLDAGPERGQCVELAQIAGELVVQLRHDTPLRAP